MVWRWEKTKRIEQLLIELEAIKLVKSRELPDLKQIETSRQRSLLKSAVYSARIEGFAATEQKPLKEAQNLLEAYKYIYGKRIGKINIEEVVGLHKKVLRGISVAADSFRTEPWAIFNEAGVAIYLAPAHFEVAKLMQEYVEYLGNFSDHPAVKAAVAQFAFEKIHPFADGNGRVGRLISAFILHIESYGFDGLIPFEQFIENHRDEYYAVLKPNNDATEFVEFFLEAIVTQGQEKDGVQESSNLLPRRQEILDTIRDHPKCSFDFLRRRFMAINPKTLHYDLGQLIKTGLVKKLGVSRGSVYEAS